MRISKIKCKCGSKDLFLEEHGEWSTEFTQENGILEEEGYHEAGNYFKVTATCLKCKKRWRVRGAVQITDCFNQTKEEKK